jgi:hypothetical protein
MLQRRPLHGRPLPLSLSRQSQLQVVPASHTPASALWHLRLHVPVPQLTEHFAAWSAQIALHPLGQLMLQ